MDIKRLQSKYNNIKSNQRNITDRPKHGSGLSLEKLPRWYEIINQALADKNQGLDDIASGPGDTSITVDTFITMFVCVRALNNLTLFDSNYLN